MSNGIKQQIAISGLGGQGVLFVTRLLAETALDMGLDVISSETHGMAVRGGAVVSHLKVGGFAGPLIRAGQADLAVFLAEENLQVHPFLIGPETKVAVNSAAQGQYIGFDADKTAEEKVGRRQAANLVLIGYCLGRGLLFADPEIMKQTLIRLSRSPAILEGNQAALDAGLEKSRD